MQSRKELGERQRCRLPRNNSGPGRVHRNNPNSTDGKCGDSYTTIRPKDGRQNDVWTRFNRTSYNFCRIQMLCLRSKLLDVEINFWIFQKKPINTML